MARVTVAKRIDAPVEAVWHSWEDFGNVYRFNPNLKHSRLLSGPAGAIGIGSERHCDLADGKNWIRERIVDVRPQKSLAVEVYDGTMPMKSMVATVTFEAIKGNRSRVRMSVDFEPKPGIVGRLMVPLMRRQFRAMLQAFLDCNAAHVEHGDVVPAAA